jgi:hypothetical protein
MTETRRRTWRDALIAAGHRPDELAALTGGGITRDELLARLEDIGVPMSERRLRSWESVGALPHPVRRWRDGAVWAVYPDWWPSLVRLATALHRDEGHTLDDLGPHVERRFAHAMRLARVLGEYRDPIDLEAISDALKPLAVRDARIFGPPTPRVTVTLTRPSPAGERVVGTYFFDFDEPSVGDEKD